MIRFCNPNHTSHNGLRTHYTVKDGGTTLGTAEWAYERCHTAQGIRAEITHPVTGERVSLFAKEKRHLRYHIEQWCKGAS